MGVPPTSEMISKVVYGVAPYSATDLPGAYLLVTAYDAKKRYQDPLTGEWQDGATMVYLVDSTNGSVSPYHHATP
jgi:hypothetical protein